jgi:hypothetical protein
MQKSATVPALAPSYCSYVLLQCFDMTMPSEARAGTHQPLAVENKDLPRWSKATMQYK